MRVVLIRTWLLLLGLGAARVATGQKLYQVQSFSPQYTAKVWVAQPGEVFSPGWVAVYDKATGRQLLKVRSEELAVEVKQGRVKSNVHELPYGEQSVLIYEDFNFDGLKDLAIEDGQNSCYHGPSFVIYLATASGFARSEGFTALAQEYCGMFSIDRARRRLSTMTKDGCCWHQFSEYVVRNNRPQPVSIIEEDARNLPYLQVSTQKWNGKSMVTTEKTTFDLMEDRAKVVFEFKLAATGKKVVLFSSDEALGYALLKPSGDEVEFSYPPIVDGTGNEKFTLSTAEPAQRLTFANGSTTYRIFETGGGTGPATVGVEVVVDGRKFDLVGDPATRKGSLREAARLGLSNLTLE